MTRRRLILIAGSGRSGTSLMALIMKTLGLTIPQPEVPADGTDPLGFGEPQWVVDLHTQLLNRVHVHTTDARPQAWGDTLRLQYDMKLQKKVATWVRGSYSQSNAVVIKDPRTLWFVPLWRAVADHIDADLSVVTMLRHPAEVVASKGSAYGKAQTTEAQRAAGWINTMLYLEKATRTLPRDYVLYDELLQDWTKALTRVADSLDVPQIRLSPARLQVEAASLVNVDLRRQRNGWEALPVPGPVIELADATWAALNDLADPARSDGTAIAERLEQTRAAYMTLYEDAESIAQSSILAASRQARAKAQQRRASGPGSAGGNVPGGNRAGAGQGQRTNAGQGRQQPPGASMPTTQLPTAFVGAARSGVAAIPAPPRSLLASPLAVGPRGALLAMATRHYPKVPAPVRAAVPRGARVAMRKQLAGGGRAASTDTAKP